MELFRLLHKFQVNMHLSELQESWLLLKKERVFVWTFGSVGVLLMGCFLLLFIVWQKLPPVIPLFYSLSWGEEQLGTPIQLLEVLGGSLLINLINFIIAVIFIKSYSYYARLTMIGSLVITSLLIYSIVKIIFLII
jgi:hypothetical protein